MQDKHIQWETRYELGIEDIDFQHHYFLNLINRLTDELTMTASQGHRNALIAELNAYARFHFISEENIMARVNYPDLQAHREHHLELISQLNSKEAMLQLEKSEQRADDVVEFLVNWFIGHTTGEDREFADFFHQQENS